MAQVNNRPPYPINEVLTISTQTPYTTADVTERIDAAGLWLTDSGVQVVSPNPDHAGGFVSWYEQDTGEMPYVYSEITGYLATMMSFMHDLSGEARYLNAAVKAAEWLNRTAHTSGSFRCLFPLRPSRFDYKHQQLYAFDTGVILNGLCEVIRLTGRSDLLASARRAGDWLIESAQLPNGGFQAVFDLSEGRYLLNDAEWSLCPGSYHTKVAIGLLNLASLTGETRYRDAAVRVCDFALSFQQPDGRFVSFPSEGGTNAHAHAYSAEGLWVAGSLLERDDYLQSSVRATEWLLRWQSPEGLVPRHFHNGVPTYNERVDILAQALRLGAIHLAQGRLDPALGERLAPLAEVVTRNQVRAGDSRSLGGFHFGRLSDGKPMPHVNVWVSAFAIQALHLYQGLALGREPFKPHFMV